MQALHIHAGPKALAHIREHGLRPEHIGVIPGAAGGPKGLILGALDRFIFGEWLAQSQQPVDLVVCLCGKASHIKPTSKANQLKRGTVQSLKRLAVVGQHLNLLLVKKKRLT